MDAQEVIDTREGALLEKWASVHLVNCRPTLLRVMQKSEVLPTPPTQSWLGRVDARTKPFETSQQARVFLQVSSDNLREVNTVLERRLPMFALYSLIRSAMEASSLALWILDSKSEEVAASRTLRIYRQNIESDRTLWRTVVGRNSGSHDELKRIAKERHAGLRGVHQSHFEQAVRSTAIIDATDSQHPPRSTELDVFSGLEVWRMCSAVTHANQVSLLNIMERHPEGPAGSSVTRTSRLSFVASAYSTALHRTNTTLSTFLDRSRPRRTNR